MLKNKTYLFYLFGGWALLQIFQLLSCASMRNPEGGPRDTTPPKILKMTPENLTTNFNAKKIIIEFDEYIKLNNVFKEFSISPELEKEPELKVKLKRLEISLPDSLEKNTTYTLNFGKAIADLNEGNELKNFNYVFATGDKLDSLSISGQVANALTGQAEIETTVFILPLDRDSLLFGKKRPAIFTLTDSTGHFKLKNLKKDKYKIYALKEKSGGDRIYQQMNDEIGFVKNVIDLNQNIDSIQLKIFKEKPESFRIVDKKFNADGSMLATFNQSLKTPELNLVFPKELAKETIVQFNHTKDSVNFWMTNMGFDSVKFILKENRTTLDSMKFSRGKKETYTRNITVYDNLDGNQLNPFKKLKLKFNLPITKIDTSKIFLLEDSIPRKYTIEKDSNDVLSYYLHYKWKTKEPYILDFREDAIIGIFDTKNKIITKSFTLDEPSNYGTLNLTVVPPDSSTINYVLEIVNKEKNVISSYPIGKKMKVSLANYKQGIYFARIIYDRNKNGVWDTGNVKEGIQPEAIWYEPKELSIRANWDREESIQIPLNPPFQAAYELKKTSSNPSSNDRNMFNNGSKQNVPINQTRKSSNGLKTIQ